MAYRNFIRVLLGVLLASCLWLLTGYAANPVFVVSLIRHGDRTPTAEIPNYPYAWPQGLGQLTPIGMQQEYLLGKRLRDRLINQLKLLPANYARVSLYVLSDTDDRTMQSASAFLYGLYPLGTGPRLESRDTFALPQGFQPIPIHIVHNHFGGVFSSSKPTHSKIVKIKTELFGSDPKIQQILISLKPLLPRLSKITGFDLTVPENLVKLGSNLEIRKIHHISNPPGISALDAQKIIAATQEIIPELARSKQIALLQAGAFLKALKEDLVQATEQKSVIKYKLYSGHDTNIAAFFSAVGKPLAENPPYASELRLELYKQDKTYYVDTYYNQQPIIFKNNSRHLPLNQFLQLITPTNSK